MSFCGIDFGTSNSAVSVIAHGKPGLIPVEDGQVTLPSALLYANALPAPLFGRMAQRLFFEGEEGRFMRSLKRLLGTGLMSQGTVVNGRMKPFELIIGDFISHLKTRAEAHTGQALDDVMMGRPVRFVDNDNAADSLAQSQLQKICHNAGFRHVEFQFEPIAAAFAHERNMTGEKLALVIDVGGGTSDFTVIRLSSAHVGKADRTQDILGNAGTRLGGNDFDKALSLAAFMPDFGYHTTYGARKLPLPESPFHDLSEWSRINFLYTPRFRQEIGAVYKESSAPGKLGRFVRVIEKETGHRVLAAVENAKIALTDDDSFIAELDFVEPGLSIAVIRPDFDKSIAPHIEKISDTLSECLTQAGIKTGDIEMIVLTGGPTGTPLLKNMIHKRFPSALLSEENRLSSVAQGLGYDSLRRFGPQTGRK